MISDNGHVIRSLLSIIISLQADRSSVVLFGIEIRFRHIYLRFEFPVLSVKMRRNMIAKEHLDADPEEAADFRHENVLEVSVKPLLVFSL